MYRSFIRKLVVLAGICGALALLAVVPVSSAAPPPDPTCNPAVVQVEPSGSGTNCQYSRTKSYGPLDTGIVCGSGASAFDIFDQATYNEYGKLWYDPNGLMTKFTDDDNVSFGQWSNPVTGDVVSYTQHAEETYVLAVPGDFSTVTHTVRGENIYRTGTGAPVLLAVGRQVFNWYWDLLSSHGPNALMAAFYEGDPHAFDQICAALGAS
jgi:hypothetical protein